MNIWEQPQQIKIQFRKNMADGQVEVDFIAHGLEDKKILVGVSEFTSCLNLKRELKEVQEELSSVKLIIELLDSKLEDKKRFCTEG